MILNYQKRKNKELFSNFEKIEQLKLYNIQNYIPIYKRFFSLNSTNYNNVNLNHINYISKILEFNEEENSYNGLIVNINNNEKKKKKIFIKISPILDPFKYFCGKYEIFDDNILKLPQLEAPHSLSPSSQEKDNIIKKYNKTLLNVEEKMNEPNNSSYVDGFFYYLSSILLNKHNFINGIDFYGSFLSIKNNFTINIEDDIDYLITSNFFIKNKNILFKVDDYSGLICDDCTINNNNIKNPIIIHNEEINNDNIIEIENIIRQNNNDNVLHQNDISIINMDDVLILCDNNNNYSKNDDNNENYENSNDITSLKSSSSCSSRTSHTNDDNTIQDDTRYIETIDYINTASNTNDILLNENNLIDMDSVMNIKTNNNIDDICNNNEDSLTEINGEENEENSQYSDDNFEDINSEDDNDDSDDSDDSDTDSDIEIKATIPKFPVQIICMEHCENTLDSLLSFEKINVLEMQSIFMQIIMSLLVYQKAFSFTHNDLHTNNIMYNETTKKFIFYCYNGIYYKVPTFGKIFKIIDFNRSIYKFNSNIFCSDSFKVGGDASTQYNTEPFLNEKNARLEPNFSFDLCRLACSIFDYLINDLTEIKDIEKCDCVVKLIVEWCSDDKGINILYKNNGTERYPDFKLYKMIARIVHNHTPENQLKRDDFKQFIVKTKNNDNIDGIVIKKDILVNIDDIPKYY